MRLTQPVMLPVRHRLGDGGNAVKDPVARPQRPSFRMLRCAQHDLRWVLLALCALLPAPCAQATELTDLGAGLSYLRVHAVADTTKAAASSGALVLDLRYATGDAAAAADLQAALSRRPANAPLYILVSPVTPAALAPVIRRSPALTLGPTDAQPTPKVVVKTDAATDRRAYDALGTGTPLDQLISGKIEKERFDEATLVEEFNNGYSDAAPAPAPDPTAAKPDGVPAKPAVLTDRVLQRAVHLHHAQLALKR